MNEVLIPAIFCMLVVSCLIKIGNIMATIAEFVSTINALTAQADATAANISQKIATLQTSVNDLQVAVNNAGNTTPEVDAAFASLTASLQHLSSL